MWVFALGAKGKFYLDFSFTYMLLYVLNLNGIIVSSKGMTDFYRLFKNRDEMVISPAFLFHLKVLLSVTFFKLPVLISLFKLLKLLVFPSFKNFLISFRSLKLSYDFYLLMILTSSLCLCFLWLAIYLFGDLSVVAVGTLRWLLFCWEMVWRRIWVPKVDDIGECSSCL